MIDVESPSENLSNESSFSSVIRFATNEKTTQLTRSIADHLSELEKTENENEREKIRKEIMFSLVSQGLAVGIASDLGSYSTNQKVTEFSPITSAKSPSDSKEVLNRLGMGDVRVYDDNVMAVMPFTPTKEFFKHPNDPQGFIERLLNAPFRPDKSGFLFIGPRICRVFQVTNRPGSLGQEQSLKKLTEQLHNPPRENVWDIHPGNGLLSTKRFEGPDNVFQANLPFSASVNGTLRDQAFRENELKLIPPLLLSNVIAMGVIDGYRHKGRIWQHANSITPPHE